MLAGGQTEPFYGVHQAGIITRPGANVNIVGLDLIDPNDLPGLTGALNLWTQDGARLTQGVPGLADPEPELATSPSRLTMTVGLGPRLFDLPQLAGRRPSWLQPLPPFSIDRLDDRWGQTDVMLMLQSDDPTSLAHATRILTAEVRTKLRVKWVQRGFRSARGTNPENQTMRNLFGQVDGTVQPATIDYDKLLWDDGSQQPWMAGGTSFVLRRISMHMDEWEALDRPNRELVIGRNLTNGAPLTGSKEHDEPDFSATRGGIPIIPAGSHVARSHAQTPDEQFLRLSYNYDDPPLPVVEPVEATTGAVPDTSNSGLLFGAFQRDPVKQFVPVQARLAEHDDLHEWTVPIGSGVWAVLPGATESKALGADLLGPVAQS